MTLYANKITTPIINSEKPIFQDYYFEAELAPPLFIGQNIFRPIRYINKQKLNLEYNSRFQFAIVPHFTLRMFDLPSAPVRTPSFSPEFVFFYYFNSSTITQYYNNVNRELGSSISTFLLSSKIAHYSNGQDGEFYDSTGNHNYRNGNFSTNFWELSLHRIYYLSPGKRLSYPNTLIRAALTYQQQWGTKVNSTLEIESALRDRYGYNRLFLDIDYVRLWHRKSDSRKWDNFHVKGKIGYILDSKIENFGTSSFERRFSVEASVSYLPYWGRDLAFIFTIYKGNDYYNIRFDQNVFRASVGISHTLVGKIFPRF